MLMVVKPVGMGLAIMLKEMFELKKVKVKSGGKF